MIKTTGLLYLLSLSLLCCKGKETKQGDGRWALIDKNATSATVAMYKKLYEWKERGILLGHQDDLCYGHGWYKEEGRSDVRDMTGDYPALLGLELGHIELGADYNLDSVYFSDMKRYVRDTHARGGVTSLSWHADNIATGGTSWDCKQDTVVRSILKGGTHHEEYLRWLDRLAEFFSDLKDESGEWIPVVFRLFHEHTGNWFWWCSAQCTPDEYVELWRMTVDYLREIRQVHNLIYAYSTSNVRDEAHYLERYPGDEYVDVLGFDHYLKGGNEEVAIERYKKDFERNLQIVTTYAKKSGKLPVIGETGMEGIPAPAYFTEILLPMIEKYAVAWILFWRNAWEPDKPRHHYLPYPGHPAEADFVKFTQSEKILMNGDILVSE